MNEFNFKKSLGQNFLKDKNVINKIISSAQIQENSLIIEIGPGAGALTKELVKTNQEVLCFEIDKRLEEELNKIKAKNLKIVYEDFLNVEIKNYINQYSFDKLYIISNLPYYITTPIITKIIDSSIEVDSLILMMQKEVGERIMASPNSKEYNSLSVFLQYYFNIKKEFSVSKECFIPKPKVDSMVLKFSKRKDKPKLKNEEKFFKLIKDSFKQKRKNLRNNLISYDLEKIEKVLKKYNFDLKVRAEQLNEEIFVEISNELN